MSHFKPHPILFCVLYTWIKYPKCLLHILGVGKYNYNELVKWKVNTLIYLYDIYLCRFIYETEHHNGVAELLEILGRWVKRQWYDNDILDCTNTIISWLIVAQSAQDYPIYHYETCDYKKKN